MQSSSDAQVTLLIYRLWRSSAADDSYSSWNVQATVVVQFSLDDGEGLSIKMPQSICHIKVLMQLVFVVVQGFFLFSGGSRTSACLLCLLSLRTCATPGK